MLIKECRLPDLSDIDPKAVACFLAGSLVGKYERLSESQQKNMSVLCRLIDKAIAEYCEARSLMMQEEKEGKRTFEEVQQRDRGQFLFTHSIINHLENCINAVDRIYNMRKQVTGKKAHNRVSRVRNEIEHMEKSISRGHRGSCSLNLSEDGLSVEISSIRLNLERLATEIRRIHKRATQAESPMEIFS